MKKVTGVVFLLLLFTISISSCEKDPETTLIFQETSKQVIDGTWNISSFEMKGLVAVPGEKLNKFSLNKEEEKIHLNNSSHRRSRGQRFSCEDATVRFNADGTFSCTELYHTRDGEARLASYGNWTTLGDNPGCFSVMLTPDQDSKVDQQWSLSQSLNEGPVVWSIEMLDHGTLSVSSAFTQTASDSSAVNLEYKLTLQKP